MVNVKQDEKMSGKKIKIKNIEEIINDLYEIINNLDDDLQLDLERGDRGASTYKESYEAVEKYTMNILVKKLRKWEKKIIFLSKVT